MEPTVESSPDHPVQGVEIPLETQQEPQLDSSTQETQWTTQQQQWGSSTQEQTQHPHVQWGGQNQQWDGQNQQWDGQNQQWNGKNQQWDGQNQQWDGQNQQWDGQNQQWDGQNQQWVSAEYDNPNNVLLTSEYQHLNSQVAETVMQMAPKEDAECNLNKLIGEGEWVPKATDAEFQKKVSSNLALAYGFSLKSKGSVMSHSGWVGKEVDTGDQLNGYHSQVSQWNAVTDQPVLSEQQEAALAVDPHLYSRKFTLDAKTGEYVNMNDPSDRLLKGQMDAHVQALQSATVNDDETVISILRRRSIKRKVTFLIKHLARTEKRELSALSTALPSPPVHFAYLPDRYIPTNQRTNCIGIPLVNGNRTPDCSAIFC